MGKQDEMKVVQLSRADRVGGWNDRVGKGEEQGSGMK